MQSRRLFCQTSLPRFLEEELAQRYKDAAPSTLSILNERCATVNADLEEAQTRLAAIQDVSQLRRNGKPECDSS